MNEPTGRRSTDSEIHIRIDGVQTDLARCTTNVYGILDEMSERIMIISDDLSTHKTDVTNLTVELRAVVESLKSIHDLMLAWNDAKGFVNVMKFFAATAKILTPIIVVISLITAGATYLYHRYY
jgi:hypothetical protein